MHEAAEPHTLTTTTTTIVPHILANFPSLHLCTGVEGRGEIGQNGDDE